MSPATPVNSMIAENSMPEIIKNNTLPTFRGYENAENVEDTSKLDKDSK